MNQLGSTPMRIPKIRTRESITAPASSFDGRGCGFRIGQVKGPDELHTQIEDEGFTPAGT